jgi:hypothetical protein
MQAFCFTPGEAYSVLNFQNSTGDAILYVLPTYSRNGEEVKRMFSFVLSSLIFPVLAGVIVHIICKWLDGRK